MSTDELTLSRYLREDYCLTHEIGVETQRQYEIAVRLFERWSGGPVPLSALDPLKVSAWLRDLSADRSPSTVRAKRVQVMSLWRAAADDGLCSPPLRRVRSVRVPAKDPVAWTHAEVCQLLAATARLQRWHPCGLRRSDWWALAVRVAWDTGLRWGDMVSIRVDQINEEGVLRMTQSKVQRPILCQLSPGTFAAARASVERCPRGILLPWAGSHETFAQQVSHLVRLAAIRPGTWKWLRRGSATDVELIERGAATAHLGHRPGSRIAADNYLDPAILGANRPAPRELRYG
jgi:integrase